MVGLLLLVFLSYLCFENKVENIKSDVLSRVRANLSDIQADKIKANILGNGMKTTRIVILSGQASTLQKKQEILSVIKNLAGVYGIKDLITIKKVKIPIKSPIMQSKIQDTQKLAKEKDCQNKLTNTLKDKKINFEASKAVIKKDSYPLLSSLAKVIKECPDYLVEIAGYTDSDGSSDFNLILSAKRAASVKKYLVIHENVDAKNLEARGYGEVNPIADNNTTKGKSENRRIEFNIIGGKEE